MATQKLTKAKIKKIKETLILKKKIISGDVEDLMQDGLGGGNDGSSTAPLHFADLGTDNYEQSFALDRLEREEHLLELICEALERIEANTFGVCLKCEKPLQIGRLEFAPWVPNCIPCQEEIEKSS